MPQAKNHPGQNAKPFDIKDTKQAKGKDGREKPGFELPGKDTKSKSKESRNDQ